MSARGALIRRTIPGSRAERSRPVLLLTLGAPITGGAASVALEAATDAGSTLILANVTLLEPLSLSLVLGYDALEELTPETSTSIRRLAERARATGVPVEWLRVRTPRPVSAILELVAERRPGLVVFGADRRKVSRRRYRRTTEALRDHVDTLVWLPSEGSDEAGIG